MKITIFGNTNNYPLRLCHALRALNHDAHLIITQKECLHRPEGLVKGYTNNYPHWIHDYTYLDEEDFISPTPKIGSIINILESSDATILNHYGPSLLEYYDAPSISFLTGSDL